jgi:hypothetical protein
VSTAALSRSRLVAWLPAAAIALLIFVMSSFEGGELAAMEGSWADLLPAWLRDHADKVAHGSVYAALGAACLHGLSPGGRPRMAAAALALACCLVYGASDEWHQSFVAGRSPDALDWVADGAGGLVGIGVLAALRRRARA